MISSPFLSVLQRIAAGLLCWTLSASGAHALGNDTELLPENEAFAFATTLLPDNQLEVIWTIADGYYMYRDKFDFQIEGDGALASPVALPKGKEKFDELFGDVEVYLGGLSVILDIAPGDGSGSYTLTAKGQGCNEPVGVCYPPITHAVVFEVADRDSTNLSVAAPNMSADGLVEFAGVDTSTSSLSQRITKELADTTNNAPVTSNESTTANVDSQVDSVSALRDLLSAGFEQPEYLAVEEAFQLDMRLQDDGNINASFNVADGYYLYKKQLKFSGNGLPIANIPLPAGEIKSDEYFGESEVYRDVFSFPLDISSANKTRSVVVEATYQGCADEGICYPPVTTSAEFTLPALIQAADADDTPAETSSFSSSIPAPATDNPAATEQRSLWTLLAGAFFAGILLTFTPCVLPLIPILSSVIAGQGENVTRTRGGALAIIYVLGTAATYAAMGALAGATGEQLQAYFQNIWAIGTLALIFFVMALSMFGLFELQLPSALQTRLQNSTSNLSGAVLPVFVLGLISALIVGACVSPVLISFLGVAVSRADPVLGAQLMFMMAMGMGVPLIALGFGAGYLIPKAGHWMETIKHLFGIMLIGVAIYMLGVLPQVPVLLLWGVFFIILSVYLGATHTEKNNTGWQSLQKGVGIVLLVWGIVALIGGFFGQRDLLQPLPENLFSNQSGNSTGSSVAHATSFTRVTTPDAFDSQLALAKSNGKNVVVDFYADWCVDCIKMEKTTFADSDVNAELNSNYVALQIDVTDPADPGTSAIKKQLGVFGPPAVLFFDEQGQRRSHKDFYGYKNTREFLALLSTQ